jgi:hypothetical protein
VIGSRARPAWLRASAQVDLAQLRRSIRPVMRSQVTGRLDRTELRRWARRAGLYAAMDGEGFFALSRHAGSARRVLRMDARPGRHLVALGRALGYPICCCRAAARCKEEGLDSWSEAIASRRFIGLFRLIQPRDYLTGRSSISHVPCSPRCAASLRMAQALEGDAGDRGKRLAQRRWRTARRLPVRT